MAMLEDVLGLYDQSNFDIRSTAALIRQLGQQAGLSEEDLGFGGVGRVYVPGNGGTVSHNPTIVQPTYQQQPTDQQEYFDQNYFNPYIGMQKGGALRQTSRYVRGQGDGQSDKIPAMLSDGEYVMDAESVSALGNGSSEAGAKKLDEFRMNLRKHKRSAPIGKIPPKTKKLNKYMSGGSR